MAYDPRSSFGQAPGVVPAYVQKQKTIQVYRVLTGLILVGAIGASVAVYMYRDYATKELNIVKAELQEATKQDEGNSKRVAELQEYDRKITTAKRLLNAHVAPSRIFEELEKSTKETVAFTKFDYGYEPGFDVTLELSANTKELESVFLQKKQISNDELFSEFILENINLLDEATIDENGEVSIPDLGEDAQTGIGFSVGGIFDKKLIMFRGDLLAGLEGVDESEGIFTQETASSTGSSTQAVAATTTPVQNNEETP
jgi:hypothetical protein